jgi:hypothetical protein
MKVGVAVVDILNRFNPVWITMDFIEKEVGDTVGV